MHYCQLCEQSQVFVEKLGDITYIVRVGIDNPDPRLG